MPVLIPRRGAGNRVCAAWALSDREVVAFHYRGYGPSSGSPTADALLANSLVIFDDLRQADVREQVITIGFSIGSGVAAYLAAHRPRLGWF